MTTPDQKKAYPSVNVRTGPELYEKLAEHNIDINYIAKRDLQRWYNTLERYLTTWWSAEEALTLCACLNGLTCTASTLYNNIYVSDELEANVFKIDVQAFLHKLKHLEYMEAWAVIDTVERAWNDAGTYNVDLRKQVVKVGLVSPEQKEG